MCLFPNIEEKLSDEHQEFVDAVIKVKKSKDENGMQQMYEAGLSLYGDELDHLFECVFANCRWDVLNSYDITKKVGCQYIFFLLQIKQKDKVKLK